jgi:hypothetical protein
VLHGSLGSAVETGTRWLPKVPLMQHKGVRAVLVTGPVGVGKTAVAAELGEVLAERGVRAAVLDLDWLGWLPRADGGVDQLILRNLRAVRPNLESAGATHLVLARSVRDPQFVAELAAELRDGGLAVARLTASASAIDARLRARDVGAELAEHLDEGALDADVGDFELANESRLVRDVAEELADRLGWT